jgi:DNA-binding IclR family transcriptional regulator
MTPDVRGMEPTRAKNPVRSIERANEILTLLKERNGARLVELEDGIDLSKGTIHSYLATLEQCGLVSKHGMIYHIGLHCLNLSGYVRDQQPLYVAGREGADELAEKSGELVALVTNWQGRCIWLYRTTGDNAMPADTHLGVRLPMHCTASGKALLAELPDERVNEIVDTYGLPAWTENTVTDRSELFDHLSEIRDRDIAFEDEERISGLRGIGVPIKTEGALLGAIAMSGPVNRLENERYWKELPDRLTKIRRMIEVNATYPGP